MIATDRRTYHLELESQEDGYMAALSWRYPADELAGLTARNDRAIAREAASITSGLTLEGLNFGLSPGRRQPGLEASPCLR